MKQSVATLLFAAGLSFSVVVLADYPDKPVRLIVPYPPAGAADLTARLIGEKLKFLLGEDFIVENRPGANGTLAADYVAKAPADGYTLLMANIGPNAIAQSIYPKLPYDVNRSFAPITQTSTVPIILVINPLLGIDSIRELITTIRSEPGKYTYASAGVGAPNHLIGVLFARDLNISIASRTFEGDAQAIEAVSSGIAAMMFAPAVTALPFVKSGKLRALAVTTANSVEGFPGVPTIASTVIPGFDVVAWGGLVAPAGTPTQTIVLLHDAVNQIMQMTDVRARFGELGVLPVTSKPEDFALYIQQESLRWSAIVAAAKTTVPAQ